MLKYFSRRIIQAIITIFVLLTILFFVMNVLPGDAALLAGDLRMAKNEAVIANIRAKWGLDQPLAIRYFTYIKNLLHGDLGTSYRTSTAVTKLLFPKLINTLKIVFIAFLLAVIVGISLGFIAALNRGKLLDIILMVIAILGISMPRFWLGLMLMYYFAVIKNILPAAGTGNGAFTYLILPALTLSIPMIALIARTTRSAVLDEINHDHVRTAKAKGISQLKVNFKHILRNALTSIITIIGLQLGTILANTVVVEKVFAWPGIGVLVVNSIFKRDIPAMQGCILVFAIGFIVINLTVDLLYAFLDPRISYS
ncbi:ABC transporter permease [Halanaerobium salsuginis]|uniref:Glutathione transport system permease protein GsiC n=1 Tax=Halanaerobium salsuginis TaxID=29563 RepID=A0A1I4EP71_9FIRM|nr:ABC transporter permease [Halanaerobium salsuginis]SFL05961.1 peptide/nickel transport system permease protein [Halanaerobium salsuginis]